jgi:uncharacterized protein YaiL (DUF2058 family)
MFNKLQSASLEQEADMSKQQKLKAQRKEIRARFQSGFEKEAVVKATHAAMTGNDRKQKRLYLTALDPLVYDEANNK